MRRLHRLTHYLTLLFFLFLRQHISLPHSLKRICSIWRMLQIIVWPQLKSCCAPPLREGKVVGNEGRQLMRGGESLSFWGENVSKMFQNWCAPSATFHSDREQHECALPPFHSPLLPPFHLYPSVPLSVTFPSRYLMTRRHL